MLPAVLAGLFVLPGCGDWTGQNTKDEEPVAQVAQRLPDWSPNRFGIYAARDFYDEWQDTIAFQWTLTNNLKNNLDDTDTYVFYGGLYGSDAKWKEGGDHVSGGLDTVEFFYTVTHGAYDWPEYWRHYTSLARYNEDTWMDSTTWRLGDDSYGLSLMAAGSCESLQIDAYTAARWVYAVRGGLKMVLGTPAPGYAGADMYVIGNLLADYFQAGYRLYASWYYAMTYVRSDNPVAVMATGESSGDCASRIYNMFWQDFADDEEFPKLQDSDVKYMCWYRWNDDDP